MIIRKITDNKKEYIALLLLADEQEDMIDRYLERGDMFVLDDDGVKAECVVTQEGEGVYELKNIAVMHECQRKGYGKMLIEFLFSHYDDCNVMLVGIGDAPSALNFYRNCGFVESHRIRNFFTDNNDHPMFEDEKQLIDMVYPKWERLIKKFEPQYLDEIMSIWLGTNISAHHFIDKAFWENAADVVKSLLPSSDLFVYQEEELIEGFIGVTDGTYIAGLFVVKHHQSKGIGTELLEHCKRRYPHLELDVFVENEGAVHFYQKHGFAITEEKVNADFNHKEYHMIWSA